jgi:hypothetical protein
LEGAEDAAQALLLKNLETVTKQVVNLRDDIEALRVRLVKLENPTRGTEESSPEATVPPSSPIPASDAVPTPHEDVPPPVNPAPRTASDNPGDEGSPQVSGVPGRPAGEVLLVEKDQSVDNFKNEYSLTPAQWDAWLRDYAHKSKALGNLTDPSWNAIQIAAPEPTGGANA